MKNLTDIKARLADLSKDDHVVQAVVNQITAQHYRAQLSAEKVQHWMEQFKLTQVEFALACLPIAACYAHVPVSNFYVGAVAIGKSGDFYFGANQEFAHVAMSQVVHAEQSAIAHALMAGEREITDMVVNYTPCGHCRQFMNELNSAKHLKIHLPHSQNNLLQSYLPDAFGPKNLNIEKVLFDPQLHSYCAEGDELIQAAICAANKAYAPYSHALSGVALSLENGQIVCGQYAENAAFNPTLSPFQSALNYRCLLGLSDFAVTRIVLAEKNAILSTRAMSETLSQELFGLPIEYIELK